MILLSLIITLIVQSNKNTNTIAKLDQPETKQASTIGSESELNEFNYNADYTAKTIIRMQYKTNNTSTSVKVHSKYQIGGEIYTTKLVSMDSMFYDCDKLTFIDLSELDTSNVTSMRAMFTGCSSLTSVNLNGIDTSKVTDMSGMFTSCESLTSIDVSGFNTSKVTDMGIMFQGCRSLTSINGLDRWNTSNVTDMGNMFAICLKLTNLDVSKFNTTNVTNMCGMFLMCFGLTSIDVSRFNTSNATNIAGMFESCESLTSIDVSSFNTSKVTNMNSMFANCNNLTSIDVSGFNTSNVTSMEHIFSNCSSLTSLNLSNWNMSNVSVSNFSRIFDRCEFNTLITPKVGNTGVQLPYTMYEENATSHTTLPTTSKTLYKEKPIITYTVTLNKNGGTINSGNVTSYTQGTTTTLPTNVTKTGYTFGGWYTNSSFSGSRVTSISSTETGNKTYYAKWTPNTYRVSLRTNGGTINSGDITEYTYGTTTNLPTNVTKTGYTFGGWYDNSSFSGSRIISIGSTETGNKTYYAKWTPNTYTVTLNANGGTINSGNVTSYTYGTTTTLPTNVTKTGNTFGGWYDNSSLSGTAVTVIGATETGNKTYWAKWNANNHTVVFMNGTEEVKRQEVSHGGAATAPSLTKEGYTLSWDKAFNNITGDLTVNAVWTVNKHTVTFKDGEEIAKTEQVNHGTGATAPSLTKDGYVLRWDKTFNNVTSDITVNAVWLKDTDKDGIPDIEDTDTQVRYTVLHYKQNVAQNGYEEPEKEETTGNLGTTVTATPKTYAGFSENQTTTERIPSGTVVDDGSLTLKLYYDRNTYTITLNPNGGTINDTNYMTEYTYGIGGNLPEDVTKEGYTFGGWYDNESLTGNVVSQVTASDLNNKTYYASWNANGNTAYKVLHYKQTENGYTLAETEELTGQTGANVNAVPKTYEGYVENTTTPERRPSGTITADGSLELKLYYDMLTYQVTFKDGDTVLNTQTVSYGTSAVEPTPAPTKEGYVLRWDKEYNNVISNLTVNTVWLRDTDGDGIPDIEDPETLVEYVVKHYKQQGNTNTYELVEEEKLQGQLGSVVNAIPKAYVGYAENTEATERRPSGTITSDEKLELILLYYRLKYTVTFKDGDEVVSVVEVLHGEEATPPNLTKPGYTLSWDKALDNITGEQTINAVWTKLPEEKREYKVEHYVETKEGGYSLKETDKLVGDIGDVVLAVPKTYNEYELNEKHEGAIREGEIKEDSELILKLYYKYKIFTVIFKDGNDIVKEEEVIYGGTATPPNLTKPGYILSWNKVLDDITKEQTITAVWTKDPNYKDPNAGKDDGKEEKPSILPKTGEETITLGAIMGLLGIAVVYFVKYKS